MFGVRCSAFACILSLDPENRDMPPEAAEQRKLAAIMFTDMVGYSALSQRKDAHIKRTKIENSKAGFA